MMLVRDWDLEKLLYYSTPPPIQNSLLPPPPPQEKKENRMLPLPNQNLKLTHLEKCTMYDQRYNGHRRILKQKKYKPRLNDKIIQNILIF